MKWKLVLCVAALALAGCKSSQENPYASFGEYGFSYDLSQQPVPGLTVAESERIEKTPSATLTTPAAVAPMQARPSTPAMESVQVAPAPAEAPAVVTPAAPAVTPAPAQ